MATSIGKLSKSFFVKLLVGIIILPFVFWGMGDVFRGGNQNIIATIDSKKMNTQEFINYLNRLNLSEQEIKNIKKSNLVEKILSDYIGKEVMNLEIDRLGIKVNDNALRDIIKNDDLFFKDDKFSRTKYEKFLLESGSTASVFEQNIAQQESRRQFLSFLSSGIIIPDKLVEKEFQKENQIKVIKYINLEKFHIKDNHAEEKIKEIYEKNKNSFIEEFKSIDYAEITPQSLIGNNEYNESFFKQLDILENKVLDGQSFNETAEENNLNIISIKNVDSKKKNEKKEIIQISDKLFKKIYFINNEKTPQVIKVNNKYYLAEIKLITKNLRPINDPKVQKIINAQLNFQDKIKNNASIAKDISMGGFDMNKVEQFASKNNLEIEDYKVSSLKDDKIFNEGIVKRIFLMKDGDVDLITDSLLTKNYLVLAINTSYKNIKKNSNIFEEYEAKARLNLINKIYKTFDDDLNQKYKVELNRRTIERVKNSF